MFCNGRFKHLRKLRFIAFENTGITLANRCPQTAALVARAAGRFFNLFYNGNDYGRHGFGVAVLEGE